MKLRVPSGSPWAKSLLESPETFGKTVFRVCAARKDTVTGTSVRVTVPEILLSGNHPAVAEWRRRQSEQRSACAENQDDNPPNPAA